MEYTVLLNRQHEGCSDIQLIEVCYIIIALGMNVANVLTNDTMTMAAVILTFLHHIFLASARLVVLNVTDCK